MTLEVGKLSLKIRGFDIEDYKQVSKLWVKAGLGFRLGDDIDSVKTKMSRDPDLFLVAEERGMIVGTVMGAWDGRRGWIYHLGVLPAYRRKGIAGRLIDELEVRMKRKGVLKVNGLVYSWNVISKRFFWERGYKVLDMTEVEKQLGQWNHKVIDPGREDGPKAERAIAEGQPPSGARAGRQNSKKQ